MDGNKKKYRVVKIEESLHAFIKHKAVDMKTSIQDIVEKAIVETFYIREKPDINSNKSGD